MSDILRLKACFHCGYDLRGSPAAGQCPECGIGYTADMFDISLHPTRPARVRIINLLWLVWLAVFSAMMLTVGIRQSSGLLVAIGLMAALLNAALLLTEITARNGGGQRSTVVFLDNRLLSDDLDLDESEEPGTWHWNHHASATIEPTDHPDRWRLRITSPGAGRAFGVPSHSPKAEVVLDGIIAACETEARTIVEILQRRFAAVPAADEPSMVR